ncbi:hypothetical protein A2164_04155 [Candidatus Curtissbacteria bacterium RBG_13_35_7]|uniref:Glycosyltransferase RgtA/B/C/D-like domain-containing protein n=1 Tax=Candidatus Curtissbacteria bacterium RBG_13_35_7 TaxID=1797705 RepID=A0A1F5G129_9BACT|nr:MAG: hypothetical protein A2164_04155 [Candidatus Curtissbacteria bacterium RBG_13_35_7]
MLLTILVIIISVFFGYVVINLFATHLKLDEKIASSFVIGISLYSLLTFLIANIFKLSFVTIIFSTTIIVLFIVVALTKRKLFYSRYLKDLLTFQRLAQFFSKEKYLLFTFIFFTVLFAKIFSQTFVPEKEGIYAGSLGFWGDGALHLTLINSFFRDDNFWPQQPLFSGVKLSYPFLPDFTSSIFLKLGSSMRTAIAFPSVLLLSSSILLLYSIFRQVTKSKLAASLAIFILFFLGGLGFIYFFEDLIRSNAAFSTFAYPPREYTSMGNDKGLHYINLITSPIVSQRAFLFGLPLFLVIFTIIKAGLEKLDKNQFIFAGILVGILPFFHSHTLLTLGIVLPVFALVNLINRSIREVKKVILSWIMFGGIAFVLIVPQLFLFFSPSISANAIHLQLGWMAHLKNENFIWFWIKNTGLMIPLILILPLVIKKERLLSLLKFYAPFAIVFIIANLIIFQPLEYDNSKLFNYWYIFSAPLVATVIVKFLQNNFFLKVLGIIIFVVIILSGFLDVWRLNNYKKNKILMFDNESINLADFISDNTEPRSVFVTAIQHNHPVLSLAGRRVLVGYTGWLWTYGINYGPREQDVRNIYQGDNLSKNLFHKYDVNYLVIGPVERSQFQINEQFFEQNYTRIYSTPAYRLYKIS